MPDYYTQYCDHITNITLDERAWLDIELNRLREGYEDENGEYRHLDFEYRYTDEQETTDFIFWSDEVDLLENLTSLLSPFLAQHRPDEYLAVTFACTCSRSAIDGFSGGMVFITAEGCEGDPQHEWLQQKIKEFEKVHPKPTQEE